MSADSATKRVFNFSAGPATVATEVMAHVQKEWMSYNDSGMGFVEMSHRDAGGPVQNTMVDTQNLVRELLKVPADYSILFMHGGAHQQFSPLLPLRDTR